MTELLYKLILCFLLGLFALHGCKSDDDGPIRVDVPVEQNMYAIVKDAAGNDLFDPATKGYIDPEESRIYAEVNGEKKLCQGKTDVAPYGVYLSQEKQEGFYFANTYLVYFPENGQSKEIIQWNEILTDTVTCELDVNNNIRKLYVNGILAFDKNSKDKSSNSITFIH